MSQFTVEEFDKIKAFRAKLKDLKLDADKNSSAYLLRWLRARDMNIPQAEEMIRNYIKWRKDENIDNIVDWTPPEDILNFIMFEESGVDKNGCPVIVATMDITKMNTFLAYDIATLKRLVYYKFEGFEKAALISRSNKNSTRQVTVLTDMGGIEIRKLVNTKFLEFFKETAYIANNYYPEILNHAIITSTPRIFTFCFALVKHFLPERTLAKMKIFGCAKDDWAEEILKYIPEDQLAPTFCLLN